MAGRRILTFIVLLVLIGLVASQLVPDERPDYRLPSAGPSADARPAHTVEATLPVHADVQAELGDVVTLHVRHQDSDEVEIVDLGIHEPVDPGLPAELTFVADQVGEFPVTLRDAGDRIGTVHVDATGSPAS